MWLPRRLQGLLLLNIPSYMGGVDLWASSSPPSLPALNDLVLEAQGVPGGWEDEGQGRGQSGLRRVLASAPGGWCDLVLFVCVWQRIAVDSALLVL